MVIVNQIRIENFRSIEKLDLKLNSINAFIGPNNAGKSNIIRALSLILGDSYPSNKAIGENSFYDRDQSLSLVIEVKFDRYFVEPRYSMQIYGFRLESTNGDVNFIALDQVGNALKYKNGNAVRVSQEMKDEIPMLFLDVDRQSSQQLRATQWTLYGKILRHIEKHIPEAKKKQFLQNVLNSFNTEIFDTSPGSDLKYLQDQLKATIHDHTGLDLTLELSILDPIEAIKNVRPYIKEDATATKYDPEEMGAGIQSALTVSIARAYSDIVKKSVILAIEEPEIHFHPQACRNMYNTFQNLAKKGLQVIYTTHSQAFVDISDFNSLHLVRKIGYKTKVESGLKLTATIPSFTKDKVVSKFNEQVNQALFSDHVILVEGQDDEIACRAMLESLKYDIFKNNATVTSCGGIKNIPAIAKVLHTLGIDTVALVDEDPGNPSTLTTRTEIEQAIGKSKVFLQVPNLEGLFGQSDKFNQIRALSFFRQYSGKIPQIYSEVIGKFP